MSETDFLNTEIGELGKKKVWQLPEKLIKVYAPTLGNVTSLEDAEKRKSLIREISKEINRITATSTMTLAGSGSNTFYTVPKNKKVFIDSITLSVYQTSVASNGEATIRIASGTSIRSYIARIVYPAAILNVFYPYSNMALSYVTPQVMYENETLDMYWTTTNGTFSVTMNGWIEDI